MNAPIDPPVPAECDLRGMPFMPFDLVRLFDSDMYALSNGEEFKAGFTLWGKSFLQVPAGSLPKEDKILAHLSGAGMRWPKVKAMAMRGWVKATDGRLYHPVVVEKVKEAWAARCMQRSRTAAARAAKISRSAPAAPVTDSVTETVTGSKGQGQGQGQGGGESKVPPTPTARDHLRKALRSRGIGTAPEAIVEWSDFLQGACKLKSADEVHRALDLILEAAKRDGIAIIYSKHAAPFADHVARTLKSERSK